MAYQIGTLRIQPSARPNALSQDGSGSGMLATSDPNKDYWNTELYPSSVSGLPAGKTTQTDPGLIQDGVQARVGDGHQT